MLGFGALGEFPLADYGTAPASVSVSLPSVDLLLDTLAPTQSAGKNFDAPPVSVAASVPVPTIGFGKSFDAPTVALALATLTPTALAGKNFGAPLVAVGASVFEPTLQVGKNFDGPTAEILLDAPAPVALAGKHFDAPSVALAFTLPDVMISFGKNVDLPPVLIGYFASEGNIQTGRIFNLAHNFTVVTDGLGALAEGALGEFAIGDGESVSATYTRPIQIRMSALDPVSYAGKNFGPSPIALSLAAPVIEADARNRPIRINAIAS